MSEVERKKRSKNREEKSKREERVCKENPKSSSASHQRPAGGDMRAQEV